MLETKEQKQILLGTVALLVILSIITLTSEPKFRYREAPLPAKRDQSVIDAQKYLAYLQTLKPDLQASRLLFEQILSEEDIKKTVEEELQVNQTIVEPVVNSSRLTISTVSNREAVVNYLATLTGSALNFNTQSEGLDAALFSRTAEAASLRDLQTRLGQVLNEFYALPSPVDAVDLQKAVIKAFSAYQALTAAAISFVEREEGASPWPELYRQYVNINDQFKIVNTEINKLAEKYNIAQTPITPVYAFAPLDGDVTQIVNKKSIPGLEKVYRENSVSPTEFSLPRFRLIRPAYAFLGIGDVTITVGDIPRIIKEAVEEGLTTSFAEFMGTMLSKLIAKIESNYLIANFLYYTDALITGQYADDYLQKYIPDVVDRQIIKRFIPQFSCSDRASDLAPVFQAKAREYLGFDLGSLRASDPDYYQKLARVGDFLSFPQGWEAYYEGLAQTAKTEAEKAAERELLSPGLKSPRDTIKSTIAISVNNIVSASRASLSALMALGIGTAKNFISGFVAQLTQTLMNKFVFRGVVEQGGTLGVLKEQRTCLVPAQLNPVLPLDLVAYQTPPPAPTQEDLLKAECAKYPRGCTVLPAPVEENP